MSQEIDVPVYFDEPTGLHYIKGRSTVLFENGIKVSLDAFVNRIARGVSTIELLREAKKNPANCGWDFRGAKRTAALRRLMAGKPDVKPDAEPELETTSSRRSELREQPLETKEILPPAVPIASAAPKSHPVSVAQKPPEPPKTVKGGLGAVKNFFSAPDSMVMFIVLFVGILSFGMSIYHTDMYLIEAGRPSLVAIIAAIAIVTFSATAYTVARYVAQRRELKLMSRFLVAVLLAAFGTSTILFSVFSTVNVSYVQFNAMKTKSTTAAVQQSAASVANNALLQDKAAQIANIDAEIAGYQRDADHYYSVMAQQRIAPDGTNAQAVRDQSRQISDATWRYGHAENLLAKARAAKAALYDAKAVITQDAVSVANSAENRQYLAYAVVAQKLGMKESDVEFIVYCIPAVFFDIISPFAIAIVLLLKDKRPEGTDETFTRKLMRILSDRALRFIEKPSKEAKL